MASFQDISNNPEEMMRATLRKLGLTAKQAKLFTALVVGQQLSVKELADRTQTDRGETYRIIYQLHKKGLIAKILASPNKYEAVAFKEQLLSLLEQRKNELTVIEGNVAELIDRIQPAYSSAISASEEFMAYIPMSDSLIRKINEEIMKTQLSIDILTSTSRTGTGLWMDSIDKVSKKGIKVRFIIGQSSGRPHDTKRLGKLAKKCFVRIISQDIPAPLAIHDSKIAMIFVSRDTCAYKASPLITNNPRIVQLVQEYFNGVWNQAEEVR
jgi:sugar-specific transcriptional regulator TrmB